MKVFLGNPPWSRAGFYGVRAGSRWPHFEHESSDYMPFPFQLAYAAAVLEREGFEVCLVDGIAEGISDAQYLDRLSGFSPDLIIHEISTISLSQDLKIIEQVRERLGQEPRIAVCGLHVYAFEPAFLDDHPSIDFSMIGEYDLTALGLARCIDKKGDPASVLGLVYRDAAGKAHANERRPLVDDLDSLPWPARHLLPMDKYHDTPGNIPMPSVQMWASRGCPFHCCFCAWPQIVYNSRRYRPRDPVRVVDEMEHLVRERGFKSVYFDDDTFNIGKPRILKICSEIRRRGLDVPWAIMARADTMDEEMLIALKGAGLRALKYGVESVDQGIIDRCGKQMDVKKTEAMIRKTRELGILYHLTFTFGLPGETRESVKKTVDWCIEMDPDTVQLSLTTPFPGSRFFRDMEKEGRLVSDNWDEYDGYFHCVVNTEKLTAREILELRDEAVRRWDAHVRERELKRRRREYFSPKKLASALFDPVRAYREFRGLYP